jgi:PAS domain S-box-containing protein
MHKGHGLRRQFDGTDTRYAALLRETTSIVWDMPANGEFHRRQLDWESFTGQSVDEYAGSGWLNAVDESDRKRVAAEWRENIASEMPFEMQYALRRSDGEFRDMQVHATPVMDEETGRVREWIGAHTDITRHREIEQSLRGTLAKLESANRELMEASDAKSSFLATMSHELRTPLNAMIGYSELLLLGIPEQPSAEIRPHIERIDLSARHLLQLIEEVLTFSRIEAGSERVHFELVQLTGVMREVNAVMLPLVNAKSIRFMIDLPKDPIELVTDPRKIRQILVNLLGNAVKFTEQGQITLSATVEGNDLVMRVSDTGIGIPAEFHEKIFDPFWQVDHGKTRAVGGTGLGLAVTRELASIMGGNVTVESRPGEGSTFIVTLPLNMNRSGPRTTADASES